MALTDLVFASAPLTGHPVALVFGETDVVVVPPASVAIAGAFPLPTFAARLRDHRTLTVTDSFPAFAFLAEVNYASNTARPTVGQTVHPWQVATQGEDGFDATMQSSAATSAGAATYWSTGDQTASDSTSHHSEAQRYATFRAALFEGAARLGTTVTAGRYQDADRAMRLVRSARYQQGTPTHPQQASAKHQDGLRDRRLSLTEHWQTALRLEAVGNTSSASAAVWLNLGWLAAYQEAMRPPAGTSPIDVVPPFEPRYLPSTHLLFAAPWSADPNLVFICERHGPGPQPGTTVVVPIKRIYMTVNTIALRRVDGDISIPAYGFAMSIDADSWTWSWSASVPANALDLVQPAFNGDPVEVEAMVNGVAYRLCVEGISRQREFATARISLQGRGTAAILDAPYAPVRNHGNTIARTAQQLMGDVLTVNGVGIGWSVDFGLTDWLVPGDVWSRQGSYIDAILELAQAAGGYVQPHATAQTLRIVPRYPAAPWAWGALTPDYELPSDVVAVEGIDWMRKPAYSRVHVSGIGQGVLGQVTRAGTAGDVLAPMVTDSLITHADAARQRGLSILSDSGRQARVSLKLPVLAETGLILPGKFVRYVDGAQTRLGLVRGTALDWSAPKLRQTISLETHID